MWDPYDTGQPLSQRGSFLEPVIPPTTEICDAPLYCFSINKDWILLLVGAAMQLAQPSTWKVNNEADRETALRRATDLCIEIGNAVQCQSAPYVPPGTDTPQAACNIAGYLANSVIRESMNQAINAINENLIDPELWADYHRRYPRCGRGVHPLCRGDPRLPGPDHHRECV